jgi:2-C-methyl-D-erythritol 2,4-cyclodiphosphate synthase
MRVGIGYDVHRLVKGESLILGGVKIDYELGLKGHSDADVLTHAIMDALLGAMSAGDIGKYFPDSDPAYKDISSLKLLEEVKNLLLESNYEISNLDATVIAQEPKLASYIPQMIENIAEILQISSTQVNIKATTTEKLGFVGKKKGIAVQAISNLE